MDPIAHTLFGATLAETGLRRKSPLATATLVIGANAPDIDAVMSAFGRDTSLLHRRGWTHGVLAMIVLPLLLTGAMLAWDRWVRRRRDPDAPPARAGPLLALSTLSILSHPTLDWMNTYGVRLLMPFDGRWFYGDSLFIVDPWMWLLAAASVVLARSSTKKSIARWVVLGALASALVTVYSIPPAAKVVWWIGVLGIVATRWRGVAEANVPRVAIACLAVLALYVGAMVASTALARDRAEAYLREHGVTPTVVMAGPEPANPFVRDVVAADGARYHVLHLDWLADPTVVPRDRVPVGDGPIPAAARRAPHVRGLVGWMRMPSYVVEPRGDGHRVTFRDVRYGRRSSGGLGHAVVDLDEDLRPLPPE